MKFKDLIIIVTCFSFGKGLSQNYNNDGDTIFGSSNIHVINFTITQPNYWDTLTNYFTIDKYMMCTVTFDGYSLDSIGLKFKGNSSYNNSSIKKSFKVGLDEFVVGQDIEDINKFNLNNGFKDPTFLREKVMLDFCNLYSMPAPRCTYAKVYINNAYWGLYMLIEETNKDFLDDRFNDKKGNLFKGDPFGDLRWYGNLESSYYSRYELKTNETQNDWSDLVTLIDKINNTPAASYYDTLTKYMHTNSYIYQWATGILFVQLDSYMGSGHNYFIYHDSTTYKWEWITWDVNEAFGNFNQGMTPTQLKNLTAFYLPANPPGGRPLNQKMIADPTFKQELADRLCDLLTFNFSHWALYPRIDSLANRIRNDVYADPNKFYTNQQFEDNINMDITAGNFTILGLKPFITARRTALANELAAYGCVLGVEEDQTNSVDLTIFPNPATDVLNIVSKHDPITQISIRNILGEEVMKTIQGNSLQCEADITGLAAGIYFILVNEKSATKIQILR